MAADLRRLRQRTDAWQQGHRVVAFPAAVMGKFGDDRGGSLAALIAYYGFFSIFPLLMVLEAVASFVLHGNQHLQRRVLDSALAEFPLIGDQIRSNIGSINGNTFVLVLGLVGAIWAGLAVLASMQSAMDEVWDVPRRERSAWLARMIRGLIVMVALGLMVLVATATAGVAAALGSWRAVAAGLAISAGLNVVTMAVIFRSMTSAQVSWNDVLPGATIAGVIWTLLRSDAASFAASELPEPLSSATSAFLAAMNRSGVLRIAPRPLRDPVVRPHRPEVQFSPQCLAL